LAVTKAISEKYWVKTFTDLSAAAEEFIHGGPTEFIEREDGLSGLKKVYGGFGFKEIRQLGKGSLRYPHLLLF